MDLDKAFVIECPERLCGGLMVVDVDEWIVKAIQAMYHGATTAVILRVGESKEFGVKARGPPGLRLESTFIYHCPGSTI